MHIVDPYTEVGYLNRYGVVEKDVYKALADADAIVLMTAHNEFKELDLRKAKRIMHALIIIDGRLVFEQEVVRGFEFVYRGIGRGNEYMSLSINIKNKMR